MPQLAELYGLSITSMKMSYIYVYEDPSMPCERPIPIETSFHINLKIGYANVF